jgi:hypothetical protein
LQTKVEILLLELGDTGLQPVDVRGRSHAGAAPDLLAQGLGQALFELPDPLRQPGASCIRGQQVCLQ